MKYFKRLEVYKASNVEYSPNDKHKAYSYGWWQFSREINGVIFFNDTRYSVSTSRHQSKVRSLLRGKEVYIFDTMLNMRDLNDKDLIQAIIKDYNNKIDELHKANKKPRIRKTTIEANNNSIKYYHEEIRKLAVNNAQATFKNDIKELIEGDAA